MKTKSSSFIDKQECSEPHRCSELNSEYSKASVSLCKKPRSCLTPLTGNPDHSRTILYIFHKARSYLFEEHTNTTHTPSNRCHGAVTACRISFPRLSLALMGGRLCKKSNAFLVKGRGRWRGSVARENTARNRVYRIQDDRLKAEALSPYQESNSSTKTAGQLTTI